MRIGEGNEILKEITAYKASHGCYPDSEFEEIISYDKKIEFYYSKTSDGEFVLWTQGYSVGESISYDSKTKKWKLEG